MTSFFVVKSVLNQRKITNNNNDKNKNNNNNNLDNNNNNIQRGPLIIGFDTFPQNVKLGVVKYVFKKNKNNTESNHVNNNDNNKEKSKQ